MHSASNRLYRAFCVVMAVLLLFPALALAEPSVPGDVTALNITSPTTAAPAYVKAGSVVVVTWDTGGTGVGSGDVRYWLGGTISLGQEPSRCRWQRPSTSQSPWARPKGSGT